MVYKLAPSILTADFTRLGEQIREVEAAGADWIHLDIMDGHFVPNITFGAAMAQTIRSVTQLPMEAHLMVERPELHLADFAQAGVNRLTVHVETCPHLHCTIRQIKELGCQAGVTLNPATSLFTLEEILPEVDLVLVMAVNPGSGSQHYIPSTTAKIVRLRAMLDTIGSPAELEVDGGINPTTITGVVKAGASILVIGSAIFNNGATIAENVRRLREQVE